MSRRSQASRPSLFLGDKWLELRALSTANIVLGHSHWVMRELENEGVAPECLRLVHNGIALTPRRLDNQERNAIRATEGWLEDEPIIVSVANLIPYKGHVELLKALGQVAAAGMRRWRLVLIGDGAPQYVKTLHSLAADLQIMDRIQFAGIRHDIGRLLAGADLGVLASHHEGFSNALLEYMDAGLPVVATSIGGNLDAVEDGKTGILVPAARSDVLADAFIRLLNDPALCIRFGAAGRAKVEAEFSLDHCIAGYEDAYRWLLARTSGRGAS